MPRRAVIWFRRDLRVEDHPALRAALADADQVVPLFVLDRRLLHGRRCGPNRRAFLLGALTVLREELHARDGALWLREGDPAEVVPAVAREAGAGTVWCSSDLTPYASARDGRVAAALERDGRRLRPLGGNYLVDPDALLTGTGTPFRVYTPFARAARAAGWDDPAPAPARVPVPSARVLARGRLPGRDALALRGAVELPRPGPAAALERLQQFVGEEVGRYASVRNRLAADGTSRLSAYLHFGVISPRQVAAAVTGQRQGVSGRHTFIGELLWRDFFAYALHHRPDTAWSPMRREFEGFTWNHDPEGLAAWQRGRTGYPLVDAGMRQLVATGWMHHRARVTAASFLTRHLLIDWREGARFFLWHLLDGDLASNNGNWQWVAATGTDSQPWDRVYNPVTQARRFDPDGRYVHRWLPELAGLEGDALLEPWTAEVADRGGYPTPIVDHAEARERALDRYQALMRPDRPLPP